MSPSTDSPTTKVPAKQPLTLTQLSLLSKFCRGFASPFWRYTQQPESAAFTNRQFGVPGNLGLLSDNKLNTPVLFFNKYLSPKNKDAQPAKTLLMIDVDSDMALDRLGCVNHAQLRAQAIELIRAKGIPALVFASASGKTKIAVAIRLDSGIYTAKLSSDQAQFVLEAVLEVFGWDAIAEHVDRSVAGMFAFALTRSVGLETPEFDMEQILNSQALDMAPALAAFDEENTPTLKFQYKLDSNERKIVIGLNDRQLNLLEYILATAAAHEEGYDIAVSNRVLARTLETSRSTVSRDLALLTDRGYLVKTKQGTSMTGVSLYQVSKSLYRVMNARKETEELKRMRERITSQIGESILLSQPKTYHTGEQGLEVVLHWLNKNKPLTEGNRYQNTPAWVGSLRKAGLKAWEIVDVICENDQGEVPEDRGTVEYRVQYLMNNDKLV